MRAIWLRDNSQLNKAKDLLSDYFKENNSKKSSKILIIEFLDSGLAACLISLVWKKKAEPRYGSSADIDAPLATRLPLLRSVAFRPCLTAGLALSWNLIF